MKRLLPLLLFLLFASSAQAAFVQSTGRITATVAASASGSFGSLPTVGNHVIVSCAAWNALTMTSLSYADNQSNTYNPDNFKAAAGTGAFGVVGIGSTKVGTSSGTFTITITTSRGTGNYFECVGVEYSGLASASWLDQVGTGSGTTGANAANVTASGANSQANEVVIAAVVVDTNDATVNLSTPTGYTERGVNQDSTATIGFESADKTISGSETSSAAWNHDSATVGWGAVIATYKLAASTAAAPSLSLMGVGQ